MDEWFQSYINEYAGKENQNTILYVLHIMLLNIMPGPAALRPLQGFAIFAVKKGYNQEGAKGSADRNCF